MSEVENKHESGAVLHDSELKVMLMLWDRGEATAKELAREAGKTIGWNKNTTYTIITKLVDKGVIARRDPGFLCSPLVSKEQVRLSRADELVGKLFDGSAGLLFASFIRSGKLSAGEMEALREMIDASGGEADSSGGEADSSPKSVSAKRSRGEE